MIEPQSSTTLANVPLASEHLVDHFPQHKSSGRQRVLLLLADASHLSLAGWAMGHLLFAGTGVSATWCVVCTILLLILLVRSGGWAVLLAIQVSLVLRDGRSFTPEFNLGHAVFVFATLALLAYACSFHTLRFGLRRWISQLLQMISGIGQPSGDDALSWQRSHLAGRIMTVKESEAWSNWRARGLVRLVVILLIAMVLFTQLPLSPYMRDVWWQRSITSKMKFWPGPGLILFLVSSLVVLAILSSRQMTSAQARMFLRSWMVKAHFSDMRRMITLHLKRDTK